MLNVAIEEMMEAKVITLKQDDPFEKAESMMRVHGIRHLPIVDESDRLVGLMTERDLYRNLATRFKEGKDASGWAALAKRPLKEFMQKEPETLGPQEPISHAVSLMWDKKYGCVPIVDDSRKVVGILTAMDILQFAIHFLK